MAAPIKPRVEDEREMAPFAQYRVHSYYSSRAKMVGVEDLVQPTAVAAIRKAFMQSNVSRDEWRDGQRRGRFGNRSGFAAAQGRADIFRNRGAQSATRIRCMVLVDGSGSMHGGRQYLPVPGHTQSVNVQRAGAAAVFGATIAKALGSVPTVALEVWQHDGSGSGHLNLKFRWSRGVPVKVFNAAARWRGGYGGNADGHAIMALLGRAFRVRDPQEKIVMLVVSDGQPSAYTSSGSGDAGSALIDAVRTARAKGATVLGVAIDGSDQKVYYGDGLITFTGDWTALGKALARTMGASLAGRPVKGRG